MNRGHLLRGFIVLALAGAGCSVFPGLRVLTGEQTVSGTQTEQLVETADLVMADKSGAGDPSLMAAADRIERATGDVADIIEIRRDEEADAFVVNLILPPPNFAPDDINARIQYFDNLRRIIELTWQGTLHESEGADKLQVNVLVSQLIPTLDTGEGRIGFVFVTTEIDREDALVYLSNRPHTLDDFGNLILEGTMLYDSPGEIYTGQPNHPMFMREALEQTEG